MKKHNGENIIKNLAVMVKAILEKLPKIFFSILGTVILVVWILILPQGEFPKVNAAGHNSSVRTVNTSPLN